MILGMADPGAIADVQVALIHPRLGMGEDDRHAFHEVILVERGDYRVDIAGQGWRLRPGQAVFYPAGCIHRVRTERNLRSRIWTLQWTGWTPGWDQAFVVEDAGRRLLQTLSWLCDRTDMSAVEALRRHLAMALLLELEEERRHSPGEDVPLVRARQMLEHGPQHPWTLDEIARHAGLSRAHFCRAFARAYGEPPLTWLARRRVDLAETLQRDGGRRLAEIAREVGYANADSLRRAMRRWGKGPGSRAGRRAR
jgi:AraC-like DNA-binding protein/mannose-6-phosphate isomerase-like protein (cupin superfamily)